VTRSRIRSIVPGASFCEYFSSRFGVALFSRYLILYLVRPSSPATSRYTGVSHDIPRKSAAGSGIGAQWTTSAASYRTPLVSSISDFGGSQ
jgi:hypothetical protein